MNKWSAYLIYHAYQLCILSLFQVVSHLWEIFNFTGGGEKRLLGLRGRRQILRVYYGFCLSLHLCDEDSFNFSVAQAYLRSQLDRFPLLLPAPLQIKNTTRAPGPQPKVALKKKADIAIASIFCLMVSGLCAEVIVNKTTHLANLQIWNNSWTCYWVQCAERRRPQRLGRSNGSAWSPRGRRSPW